MRQILFRIWFEHPWSWIVHPEDGPLLGASWVVLAGALLFGLYHWLRQHHEELQNRGNWVTFLIALVAVNLLGSLGVLPASLPVFGYGAMVLIGFVSGLAFARGRAKAVGIDPEIIMDLAFWLLLSGIAGGRTAYLVQYGHLIFPHTHSLGEALFAMVNLSEGGLVLIGALAGGFIGFTLFCWQRQVNMLELVDVVMPAVFIGIGFGRIGCLLNGCCYGGPCELPWAIEFPRESTTFKMLVERGLVPADALTTGGLHPTQIYSSLIGFLLAGVTSIYYWYRKYPGDVFALACILYPIARFQMEILRNDELGQLGTSLTISQIYSLIIFTFGIIFMFLGPYRARFFSNANKLSNEVTT